MLPTELLQNTFRAGRVSGFSLEQSTGVLELARNTIELFVLHQGRSRRDLDEALEAETANSTDYRMRSGLAHLLYPE
ncbi:MAG: DUF790 family protein [Deinococcales bacterium]